jgi:hypothetical protein
MRCPSGVALRSTRSASIDRAHSITWRTSRVPYPLPRCAGKVITFASRTVRPCGHCGFGTPSSSVPIAVATTSPSTSITGKQAVSRSSTRRLNHSCADFFPRRRRICVIFVEHQGPQEEQLRGISRCGCADAIHCQRGHPAVLPRRGSRCGQFGASGQLATRAPGPGMSSRSPGLTGEPSAATSATETVERSLRRRAIRGGFFEMCRSPHCMSASSTGPSSRPFVVNRYSNRSGRSL